MFSVLIPAYKAKYLRKAIESVLKQSFDDFELVILNDKSPEDIQSIVASYQDPRVIYQENKINLGKSDLVGCWNICLSFAKRPFSVLFSDDDIMHVDFLKEMKGLTEKFPDVNVYSCRVAVIDSYDKIKDLGPSAPEYEPCIDFVWHRISNLRLIYAANFAFRTAALQNIGGFIQFPLAWGSDEATWFTLAKQNGIASTNKILCYWRWSELNISNIGDTVDRLQAVELYNAWLTSFVEKYECKTAVESDIKGKVLQKLSVNKINKQSSLIERMVINRKIFPALIELIRLKIKFKLSGRVIFYAVARRFFFKK